MGKAYRLAGQNGSSCLFFPDPDLQRKTPLANLARRELGKLVGIAE